MQREQNGVLLLLPVGILQSWVSTNKSIHGCQSSNWYCWGPCVKLHMQLMAVILWQAIGDTQNVSFLSDIRQVNLQLSLKKLAFPSGLCTIRMIIGHGLASVSLY